MTTHAAVFRCDASTAIGTGHVMRCLTLADALHRRGWECGFAVSAETLATVPALEQSGFALDTRARTDAIAGTLAADTVIVDHYGLNAAYESSLRRWADKVVVLDDLPGPAEGREHDCDLLLDGAARTGAYAGRVPDHCRLLLGPDFALLRPEFFAARLAGHPDTPFRFSEIHPARVAVALGGTDPDGRTRSVLAWLAQAQTPLDVTVILGAACPHWPDIEAAAHGFPHKLALHRQVGAMAELLRETDLAIGGAGNSAWERCCLGVPSLLVLLAENQRGIADRLRGAGAAQVILDVGETDIAMAAAELDALLDNRDALTAFRHAAFPLCDGLGAARSATAIAALAGELPGDIRLRPATAEDTDILLYWQTHPETRKHFRNPTVPGPDEHTDWMARVLADPSRLLHIAENENGPVGMIRLDRGREDWEVSIITAPEARGKGIGGKVLKLARALMPDARLTAEVLPGNTSSQRLFEAAGYQALDETHYVSAPLSN